MGIKNYSKRFHLLNITVRGEQVRILKKGAIIWKSYSKGRGKRSR